VEIAPGSDECLLVASRVGHIPTGRVARVERVQHRFLHRKYTESARAIADSNSDDSNEIFTFFGSSVHSTDVLLGSSGLDPGKSQGGFYGRGVYTSLDPCYQIGGRYAHYPSGFGGRRVQLLLVRLARGCIQDLDTSVSDETRAMINAGMRPAPDGHLPFHCIRAGPHRPHKAGNGVNASIIYVGYKEYQTYPSYIVTFDIEFEGAAPLSPPPTRAAASTLSAAAATTTVTAVLPAQAQPLALAAAEKAGHPIGSKRCWISSNSDIAAGELGEVLGVTDAGLITLIRMKFAKGTWGIDKDDLLTKEKWDLKVAAEKKAAEQAAAEKAAAEKALVGAAADGNVAMVMALVTGGAKRSETLVSVLVCAASNGHLEIVRFLLHEHLVLICAAVNEKNNEGHTALVEAAFNGHLEVVRFLLQSGAAVNEKDNEGDTALVCAASDGHLEVVRFLLQSGAAVNEKDIEGNTALFCAASDGHLEVVRFLLQSGAAVNEKDNDGDTALVCAASNGHLELVRLLIEHDANVDAKDACVIWAFVSAAGGGRLDIVRCLIDKGLDVNGKGSNGDTALIISARKGHSEITDLLLSNGANINDKNAILDTALICAARKGHVEVAVILLRGGADASIVNRNDDTALSLAKRENHTELVKLLGGQGKGAGEMRGRKGTNKKGSGKGTGRR